MPEEIDVLKLVCRRLDDAKIPYMLTGSLAANFYAAPRMTRDIDIVIEIFEADIGKFFQAFQEDFYIDQSSIADAIEHQSMFNIIHNNSVLKIDFLIRKDLPYRSAEFQRRRQINLDDMKVWIVAPEDLVISKLFWSKDSLSDFQLRDVKNILVSTKNLDELYIEKWVETLGLDHVYAKVKNG
jgi:hypothetical protein